MPDLDLQPHGFGSSNPSRLQEVLAPKGSTLQHLPEMMLSRVVLLHERALATKQLLSVHPYTAIMQALFEDPCFGASRLCMRSCHYISPVSSRNGAALAKAGLLGRTEAVSVQISQHSFEQHQNHPAVEPKVETTSQR